jgi:surface carbohydrate biosynthesis protein
MNILLPIETIARELDYKIFLAIMILENGEKAYIGQHDILHSLSERMSVGIYVGKNIFLRRADEESGQRYYNLKKNKINVIYLHEEGAVFTGGPDSWERVIASQYSLDYFDQNDAICVWGDFQKRFDDARSKGRLVEVTGHPRFDLYKPKYREYYSNNVAKIKDKFGKYILINGNYSLPNHGMGLSYVFSEKSGYDRNNLTARFDRVRKFSYYGRQLMSMVELTHKLAIELPQYTVIYRPHPSESRDFYETVFYGVENIYVEDDGSVGPWIFSADAVIHDGCTTAIEAHLAGKKVIHYKPEEDKNIDIWLPNQIGVRAESVEDVLKYICDDAEYYTKENLITDDARDLLYNFDNDSYQQLLSITNRVKINSHLEGMIPESPSSLVLKYEIIKSWIRLKLSSLKNLRSYNYHNRKFPGFEKEELIVKVRKAEKILGKKVKLKFLSSQLFIIELQ